MAIDNIFVIGDRVLVSPDSGKDKTSSGLFLPQGMAEKESVQSGYIVKIGPGFVVPYHAESSEPWQSGKLEAHYIPLQVRVGDFALFLRREAVEIEYQEKKYLIVPQSGILAVVRDILPQGI